MTRWELHHTFEQRSRHVGLEAAPLEKQGLSFATLTLFLARDRLGVKPLYYSGSDGTLTFASGVKALILMLGRARMNVAALPEYLTFLWVPDPTLISAFDVGSRSRRSPDPQ